MTEAQAPQEGRGRSRWPHPLGDVRSAVPFGQGPPAVSPDCLFGDLGFLADLGDQTGWTDMPMSEAHERFRRLTTRYQALKEIAEATPRRGDGYQPGDAAAVLVKHVSRNLRGTLQSIRNGLLGAPDQEVARMLGVELEFALFAVPYYMSIGAGRALAGSHSPPSDLLAEIRLPFPSVLVLFGGPLQFGPASKWVTSSTNGTTQWEVLHDEGGTLHGVVLCGDGTGKPFNVALYLLTLGLQPDATATFISGELRYGAFSSIAANAASIVSWGSWTEPDFSQVISPNMSPGDVRDTVRRGAFRRRSWSGAALGAHVIDLGRTFEGRTGETSGGTVAPHLRRGHWRRVRIGPRGGWHYEGRWIAPTLVNANEATEIADVLYRLPDPPDGPAPEDEVEDLTT